METLADFLLPPVVWDESGGGGTGNQTRDKSFQSNQYNLFRKICSLSTTDRVQCLRIPGFHPPHHRHCDEHQQQHQATHQSHSSRVHIIQSSNNINCVKHLKRTISK